MAFYSAAQIAQVAKSRGFTGNALVIVTAVALAESGGNTNAHNGGSIIDREDSYGLWQINILAHPQYSAQLLYNPSYCALAAYTLSNRGTNWNAWRTYQNGSYRYYLPFAQQAVNSMSSQPTQTGGGGSGGTTITLPTGGAVRPWYTYPRIDNFGQIDPERGAGGVGYWKPDSNILTPPGHPVTALLSGMVTSVQRTSWGQTVVTIRLNTPLNTLATHTAYQHMHDATVVPGQRVLAGQLIGHANYVGEGANLGFSLYSGDVYGSGAAWNILQNDLRPGGAGLLNPVALLNAAAAGRVTIPSGGGGGNPIGGIGQALAKTYTPLSQMVHETLISNDGFYAIALSLDEAEQFPGWVDLTTPQQDISVAGVDTGFAPPDIPGEVRSIGATISDNAIPFFVRSGLVSIGLLLMTALLIKAIAGPAKAIAPLALAA